jgi:putative DNA-invertase from lambdoid prophage Rac
LSFIERGGLVVGGAFMAIHHVAGRNLSNKPATADSASRCLFDKLRAGDVLIVRWVDRLGRNYEDVCDTIQALMRRGVVIRTVINNMTFDGATTNPMEKAVRDALIAFMAALGQAHAEATKLA